MTSAGLRFGNRVRRVVAGDDLVGELGHARDLHELTRPQLRPHPADEGPEAKPLVRGRPPRVEAGVRDHEPGHALGPLGCEAEADRPAPVVDDDRQVSQVELVDEALDRCVMAVVRVPVALDRLVRAAEAEVVGREHAGDRGDRRDRLAVEERPGRLAVQEQDRVARALVQVVHP